MHEAKSPGDQELMNYSCRIKTFHALGMGGNLQTQSGPTVCVCVCNENFNLSSVTIKKSSLPFKKNNLFNRLK